MPAGAAFGVDYASDDINYHGRMRVAADGAQAASLLIGALRDRP